MMKFISALCIVLTTVVALIPQKDYKPNVFVLTDISNEPDDAESLVRLFLYSNEINLHGIVATTSVWLNDTVHDEDIYPIIDGYEEVYDNLQLHSTDYPPADYLRSIVKTGHKAYGLAALENDTLSSGAEELIETIDQLAGVDDYLYVLVWGGANVLAEALNHFTKTRSEDEVDEIISRLSVYAISDQDNTGIWIRNHYPHLKYIASVHAFNHYQNSAWVGISGEDFYAFDEGGPDSSLISDEWVKANIQDVGPYGAHYINKSFIYEGDTPTTFSIIPNGLNYPAHPEYGGWGGRYNPVDPSMNFNHYGDVEDHVVGSNGANFTSRQATVWRWREGYQNDFAARMQWTTKSFNETSHAPIIIANDTQSVLPMEITAVVGSTVTLDLSKTYDQNGLELEFDWFHYLDITSTDSQLTGVAKIEVEPLNEEFSKVEFQVPSYEDLCLDSKDRPMESCKENHIIAQVTNDRITSYKRFLIKAIPDQ